MGQLRTANKRRKRTLLAKARAAAPKVDVKAPTAPAKVVNEG